MSAKYFDDFLLVVIRSQSWSPVVIRGHSWSLVCTSFLSSFFSPFLSFTLERVRKSGSEMNEKIYVTAKAHRERERQIQSPKKKKS